jgi:hypothetical protein
MTDGGECGRRATRIAVAQDDDFMSARVELGGHDGGVVGLRAATGEEGFLQTTGRDLMEFFGEVGLRLVGVERRSVLQRLDLLDDSRVDLRVGVADAHREHAAEAVQITFARIVPHVHAFAAHERERLLIISSDGGEEKLFMLADGF